MIFSTLDFLVFFCIVWGIYWYVLDWIQINNESKLKLIHWFLLLASYWFYMSWDYRFGALILFSTALDFYLAKAIHDSQNPRSRFWLLQVSLVTNLVFILGFFKYYTFLSSNYNDFLKSLGVSSATLPILKIVLPVGISFYTFQSLSYTIDVYRGSIPVERSFLRFALFVSFFPQLVAGPIVTAKQFLPQLESLKKFENIPFTIAIRYFLMGYIKKVILSDNTSPITDLIFENPENYATGALWLAAFLFWVQVYCDFSGYSDMAYGTALLFGFELPTNFNLPYISRSIREHWTRWHMTLNLWFRDYVYIPLGGNRVSNIRFRFNLWVTMFLAGFWHGANWTFLIWGSIQATLLVIENILAELRKNFFPDLLSKQKWFTTIISWTYTSFVTVTIGTIFRSTSLENSGKMFQGMFSYQEGILRPYMLKIGIPCILAVFISHFLGIYFFEKKKTLRIPKFLEYSLYPIVVLALLFLSPDKQIPFVYFQF